MAAICGLGSPLEIVNAVLPTNVTLNSARLEGVAWVLGDGGLSLNSVKGCSESLEHLGLGRGAVYA